MTQRGAVFVGQSVVHIELPGTDQLVLPALPWGSLDAFPTPAYWTYLVMARRAAGATICNRLGHTLAEEVAACLLGGHGMPASVGVAAFEHLKSKGVFEEVPSRARLLALLTEPLLIGGRQVHYRFARQRADYLSKAFEQFAGEKPSYSSGKSLREWLAKIPGIGCAFQRSWTPVSA